MESKVPNIEKKLIGIKDIFELYPKDIEILKKTIKENNGCIRVFIHPNYGDLKGKTEETLVEPRRGFEKQFEFYKKGLNSILFSKNIKNTPLFIFEESSNLVELKNFLGEEFNVNNVNSNIILIPTIENQSTPDIYFMDTKESDPWEWSNKFFIDLGVKEILLGGMNLTISTRVSKKLAPKEFPMLDECVADFFYHHIENPNIKIEFSSFTYPNDRYDARRMYEERKKSD